MKTRLFVTIPVAVLALSSFVTGCLRPSFETKASQVIINEKLSNALAENNSAASYAEWHASESHPEKLFSEFMTQLVRKQISPTEICKGLLNLKTEDLTLFENEVRAPEHHALVKSCYPELNSRLESYWTDQRIALDQTIPSTEIPYAKFEKTELVVRDVSQGYYAITGDLAPKQVMLTFDDGPSGIYTEKILATLARSNVKSLFFELGEQVKKYPQIVQKVADAGHSIGSHSTTHKCLPTKNLCRHANNGKILSFNEAIAELRGGHQAIYNVLGWVDPFIRFPFGESSPELKGYLRDNGIGEFLWNVDSEDWMNSHSPANVIDLVMSELNSRGRGIVLFHDIQRKTAEALPTMLKRLQNDGYQPVVMIAKDPLARTNSKIIIPKKEMP